MPSGTLCLTTVEIKKKKKKMLVTSPSESKYLCPNHYLSVK